MPQQTKIFRVFISSTFTDMREERRILQQDVFPRLEKFCEERGAKFQAVDLRWGVNEDSQLNQKTLEICLNEIARCQKITPKPNFIILLGDKYGWQPLPHKIPVDEMKDILDKLADDKKEIIKHWYELDENAIPPEYILQPRTGDLTVYDNWKNKETEIRNILREAVIKLNFSAEQKIKYFASATHQEIISGALNPPAGTEKPEDHVFAFVRTINGLPDDDSAKKHNDIKERKKDADKRDPLDKLKEELSDKLGEHYIIYDADWKNGKSELDKDKFDFEKEVYEKLEGVIKTQMESGESIEEVKHEAKLHEDFMNKLTEHFSGRKEILETIRQYIKDSDKKVFTMIGESGSGKSSVMAQAVKNCKDENINAEVIYRFIGTTSSSSNIVSLLQNVCREIAQKYNVDLNLLAGKGNDKALYDLNGLTEVLRKCLALGKPDKPLIIYLDALDQLSDTDNARALNWIPRELPAHTKFIVSALPELKERLNNTTKEELPLLPQEDAEEILNKWLGSVSRKLTNDKNSDQYSEVINKFNKTQLPIYLKLAFEKARYWHSYDTDFSLSEGVKGIINDFIDNLKKDGHDEDFVEHVICYMLCGRYQGLAENEILEILVFDKEYWEKLFLPKTHEDHRDELKETGRFPIVVWSRFFLDMEPFLTERDADGVPIITFFHRQFNEVLQKRYGLIEK